MRGISSSGVLGCGTTFSLWTAQVFFENDLEAIHAEKEDQNYYDLDGLYHDHYRGLHDDL